MRAAAGHELNDARRQLELLVDQPDELERGQRRDLARLDHDGVARQQRRRELAAQHRERKVPGTDRRDHADGRPQQVDHLAGVVARQDLALEPAVPFGAVAEQRLGKFDLAASLLDRLTDLGYEQRRKALAALREKIGERTQMCPTMQRRGACPPALSRMGGAQHRVDLLLGCARHRNRSFARSTD